MEATIARSPNMGSVLTQLVELANHSWENWFWNMLGYTSRYHCDCGDAVNTDGYRGIPHYVKYGEETIAVLTLWEGYEDRFVVGSTPKHDHPHHAYYAQLCRQLEERGVRFERGRPLDS